MIKFTHLIILLLLAHCVKLVTSNVKWTRLKSGQFRNKILKFAATSGNNSQYMFGGEIDGEGRYTNNLFVLNDPNLEWSILSANGSFPSRRSGSTLTKIGSSLYVIGGHNDNGTLNTIYRFGLLILTLMCITQIH
eukprot:XP_765576.1 hypothetical protein [Theileria parva strain Muguga]